jgi:hypothetical protein
VIFDISLEVVTIIFVVCVCLNRLPSKFGQRMYFSFILSNGHSPQIRENGELLVRMCRGESHFSQKWPLANVGESGESSQHGLANVGESGESSQKCLANVGESGEYLQSLGP